MSGDGRTGGGSPADDDAGNRPGTDAAAGSRPRTDAPSAERSHAGDDARTRAHAGEESGTPSHAGDDAAPGPGAAEPTLLDTAALTDRRKGLGQVVAEDFSLAESIGGVRGVIEAVAPGAVFVTAFVVTRELTVPLVASLAVAVVACVARLVQRTPLTQALSGLLGVGIGVVWAWRSGQAEDFFAWGLYVNAAYAVGILLATLLRWPPIGVLVELLRGRTMAFRTDPAMAVLRRRYVAASWLWVGVFTLRLVVQVPLYLAGEVAALGVARLLMGLPLFALAAWFTWALVREPQADPEDDAELSGGPAAPAAR